MPRCCPGALRQGPSSSPETHLPPPFKHHVWCTQLEKTIRIPCPDFQVLHKPPSPGQLLLCAPSRDQLQGSTTTPPDPIQSLAHLREEPQSQEAWHRAPGSLSSTSCICSLTVLWKSGNWRDLCFVFFSLVCLGKQISRSTSRSTRHKHRGAPAVQLNPKGHFLAMKEGDESKASPRFPFSLDVF